MIWLPFIIALLIKDDSSDSQKDLPILQQFHLRVQQSPFSSPWEIFYNLLNESQKNDSGQYLVDKIIKCSTFIQRIPSFKSQFDIITGLINQKQNKADGTMENMPSFAFMSKEVSQNWRKTIEQRAKKANEPFQTHPDSVLNLQNREDKDLFHTKLIIFHNEYFMLNQNTPPSIIWNGFINELMTFVKNAQVSESFKIINNLEYLQKRGISKFKSKGEIDDLLNELKTTTLEKLKIDSNFGVNILNESLMMMHNQYFHKNSDKSPTYLWNGFFNELIEYMEITEMLPVSVTALKIRKLKALKSEGNTELKKTKRLNSSLWDELRATKPIDMIKYDLDTHIQTTKIYLLFHDYALSRPDHLPIESWIQLFNEFKRHIPQDVVHKNKMKNMLQEIEQMAIDLIKLKRIDSFDIQFMLLIRLILHEQFLGTTDELPSLLVMKYQSEYFYESWLDLINENYEALLINYDNAVYYQYWSTITDEYTELVEIKEPLNLKNKRKGERVSANAGKRRRKKGNLGETENASKRLRKPKEILNL
eukprot:NODE_603_length_5511_cov_0.288987.p2 type:complete len:534 gc:universal NODE_603_length_5511_cov_0.288987:5155-3554(-)